MTEAERTKITVGDEVMVCFSTSDQTHDPARKFNGEKFIVKKIVMPKGPNMRKQFMLYGANSDAGLPFWFLEEDLVKL